MRTPKHKHFVSSILIVVAAVLATLTLLVIAPRPSYAADNSANTPDVHFDVKTGDPSVSGDTCGGGDTSVSTSLNYGCNGSRNGIEDFLYAIIRFLSAGVGLVVIASVVFAGIQYTTSEGDPGKAAKAVERIRNSLIALAIYIFAFALLSWLIPGGIF